MNNMTEKMETQWERLCELHSRTKHYLLIAEELSDDDAVFLQPLKEHRDAYDHIMRAYSAFFHDVLPTKEKKEEYIERNMEEAYGHEFRAFFDTGDWLSVICRKYIRTTLKNQNRKKLSEFKDYERIKKLVNSMPVVIAKIRSRESKYDTGIDNNRVLAPLEQEYKSVMDMAKEAYQKNEDVKKNIVDPRVEDYCAVLNLLISSYILVRNQFDR